MVHPKGELAVPPLGQRTQSHRPDVLCALCVLCGGMVFYFSGSSTPSSFNAARARL